MEFLTTKAAQLKFLSVKSLPGTHHEEPGQSKADTHPDRESSSSSVFKHQHSLQVICQPPDTPDHLTPKGRTSHGQLMKAKSDSHFQLASNLTHQIKEAITHPSSPSPVSPGLQAIKNARRSVVASHSFSDIFSSLATFPIQVVRTMMDGFIKVTL